MPKIATVLLFIYTENHISYFHSTNSDPAELKNCKMTQAFSKLVYRNITRINSNYLQTFPNLNENDCRQSTVAATSCNQSPTAEIKKPSAITDLFLAARRLTSSFYSTATEPFPNDCCSLTISSSGARSVE